MKSYRKNCGGIWQVCTITDDEAKTIQNDLIKMGISKATKIQAFLAEKKIVIPNEVFAVIMTKILPSFESMANDYIEKQIKEREIRPQQPQ